MGEQTRAEYNNTIRMRRGIITEEEENKRERNAGRDEDYILSNLSKFTTCQSP
jgi:hypothetical protein